MDLPRNLVKRSNQLESFKAVHAFIHALADIMKLSFSPISPLGLFLLYVSSSAVIAGSELSPVKTVPSKPTAENNQLISGKNLQNSTALDLYPSSLEELKLDNTSILALGANSRIKLDRGSNNTKQYKNSAQVFLEKGPFRLITTSSSKKDVQIQTPNISLSSEASILDLYIATNGAEYLLLHSGTTKVCKNNASEPSSCRLLNTPCKLVRISPNGKIGDPLEWRERTTELDLTFSETFPFILTPPKSDPVIYHSRVGVEDSKCSSTTLANKKPYGPSPYETGALPEKPSTIKKSENIKVEDREATLVRNEKGPKVKVKSKTPPCPECEYFNKADTYVSKILTQAENNFSKWWLSLSAQKSSKKL